MNKRDFFTSFLRLKHKVSLRRGKNEVYHFETSHIRGIVRIGDTPSDRTVASASLASVKTDCNVGFHLELKPGHAGDVTPYLEPLLSTFAFTVSEIPADAALGKLVDGAKIIHPRESGAD